MEGGSVKLTFDMPVVLGNTTMCGLFTVRGSNGRGACCTASPFELSSDSGEIWIRTAVPKVMSSATLIIPIPSGIQTGPPLMLRYAWVDTPMCMLFRSCSDRNIVGSEARCPPHPLPAVPFNVTVSVGI